VLQSRHPVPDRLICPKCDKRGLVRSERIITKQGAKTHYFCGHCDHEWDAHDPPATSNDVRKPRGKEHG
jgi:transcription elongation factor Elf1